MRIRPAVVEDAPMIAALADRFAHYLRALGDPTDFRTTEQTIARDAFGAEPAFKMLVAETDDRVVGYLSYHFGYDADAAARIVHLIDLFVDEHARRQGAGRLLMDELAELARSHGAKEVVWAVYKPNRLARMFYERYGAKMIDDLDFMHIKI